MIIQCVDNALRTDKDKIHLTKGKFYETILEDHDFWCIEDDSGKRTYYYKNRFVALET